ncbi:hypothetical protein WKW80_26125 [Variovorax humicola]|uniref:Dyp-type peroxidase C-terminal domain-containing protein n=1 Tax=Variovorax humicola TaxID=1769758 RepID=A0ABU8W641_9BURK
MAQQIKRSTVLGGITNLSVLAPVKKGMVIGFEPISYLERLRKVLDALYSARQNVRESELLQPVFPDSVGRFGIIDHFRYALVPPIPGLPDDQPQPEDGTWRLSLNVTFDGGWEPYMRVIYRDLGTLLDLLFCNCEDYPGSKTSRYEDYCAWVRRNEVAGGTFYADSVMPLGDHEYLAEVEKKQREQGALATVDKDIATHAVPSAVAAQRAAMARGLADVVGTLVLPLRTLTGLYRLSIYFPPGDPANNDGDRGTLRRFAQSVLQGSIDMIAILDKLQPGQPGQAEWAAAQARLVPYLDALGWLKGVGVPPPTPAPAPAAPPYDPTLIQSHVLTSNEPVTHGCVVLLRVTDAGPARTTLAALAPRCGPLAANGVACLVGFTHAGLAALGVAQSRLIGFPQEFIEGMEARSSLLGDVRVNHPDRWRRPLAWGNEASGHRVDMKAVHVLIQLRLTDPANSSADLHPLLKTGVDVLNAPGGGLRVLAVQPTFSQRNLQGDIVGHLGFVDGISQPRIDPDSTPANPPKAFDDRVRPGELLLGHANNRNDAPNPAIDPLKFNGSFLVVRKLRQNMDTLDAALSALTQADRDHLLSRVMGRHPDGTPLVSAADAATGLNNFNYDSAGASDACPFHSHIRRANPRDKRPYTPRIIRRGMSYGQKQAGAERGLVFMAYCASLSEQYETIQRWISGGNSSGVGSAQGDALLRVPQHGENYTFRYLDKNGSVARFVFDDQPLAHLEWGLYVFVPSLTALAALDDYRAELPAAVPPPSSTPPQTPEEVEETRREEVRQRLDDPDRAPAAWTLVRNGDPKAPQDTPYGHLLGTHDEILKAMKDDGSKYSVEGYGDRMSASIGLNLLGLDGAGHAAQLALNHAVLNIDEQTAYDVTIGVVKKLLADKDKFPVLPSPIQDDLVRQPIDTLTLADQVMAALCTQWIGLPDAQGKYMIPGGRLEANPGKPRCPGNFATASRYIFSPQPRQGVVDAGQQQGKAVLLAVQSWLTENGTAGLGSLAQEILDGLNVPVTDPVFALNLAGVLLGFPPTVEGNFLRTMETWIKDETLWDRQEALFEATSGALPTYAEANAALRATLLATMRKRPVPEMLWRCPVGANGVDKEARNHVVLGIASALTDPAAPDDLMFGRNKPDATNETVHGCPGYYMAMGVMLAMFAGLLNAGTLRPTGSPVLLILTPKPAPAPAATAN